MNPSGGASTLEPIAVHWFRRDLRLEDNTALWAAAQSGLPVLAIFIFDKNILSRLKLRDDRRVAFIHETLVKLQSALAACGGTLWVFHGTPREVFASLFARFKVAAIFCNEDYEPYARKRDAEIAALCAQRAVAFNAYKDHVIFAPHEILKEDGSCYQVFTPYARRWLAKFEQHPPVVRGTPPVCWFCPRERPEIPSLEQIGFAAVLSQAPPATIDKALIRHYDKTRDLPAIRGTSRLGVHLRFGTISVRRLALVAHALNEKFLRELIWREFYQMLLWHFPHTVNTPFRSEYVGLKFPGSEADFRRWRNAETGYDLVDAGIRELVSTGFMHNRVRMVVASFLTKHLLCDWRWGEHFFAQYLLDFEQASNVGSWQWCAGIGADAAPYFRIFNPTEQQKKFDPDGNYVRHWLGDPLENPRPKPMVDHRFARERCLHFFSQRGT
ncbi:MAG: DNA photolyase family protein [Turneriella sp.]|nr:DNA photolyase family protein [Turneriella sp.]